MLNLAQPSHHLKNKEVMLLLGCISFSFIYLCFPKKLNFNEALYFFLLYYFLTLVLTYMAFVDFYTYIIEDFLLIFILVASAIFIGIKPFFEPSHTFSLSLVFIDLWHRSLSGFCLGLILLLMAFLSKGLGGGDIKLFSVLAFSLGFFNAFKILMVAFIFSGIGGLAFIIFKKGALKEEIAFGPFILCSAFVVFINLLS